jgi:hypothetical protein
MFTSCSATVSSAVQHTSHTVSWPEVLEITCNRTRSPHIFCVCRIAVNLCIRIYNNANMFHVAFYLYEAQTGIWSSITPTKEYSALKLKLAYTSPLILGTR